MDTQDASSAPRTGSPYADSPPAGAANVVQLAPDLKISRALVYPSPYSDFFSADEPEVVEEKQPARVEPAPLVAADVPVQRDAAPVAVVAADSVVAQEKHDDDVVYPSDEDEKDGQELDAATTKSSYANLKRLLADAIGADGRRHIHRRATDILHLLLENLAKDMVYLRVSNNATAGRPVDGIFQFVKMNWLGFYEVDQSSHGVSKRIRLSALMKQNSAVWNGTALLSALFGYHRTHGHNMGGTVSTALAFDMYRTLSALVAGTESGLILEHRSEVPVLYLLNYTAEALSAACAWLGYLNEHLNAAVGDPRTLKHFDLDRCEAELLIRRLLRIIDGALDAVDLTQSVLRTSPEQMRRSLATACACLVSFYGKWKHSLENRNQDSRKEYLRDTDGPYTCNEGADLSSCKATLDAAYGSLRDFMSFLDSTFATDEPGYTRVLASRRGRAFAHGVAARRSVAGGNQAPTDGGRHANRGRGGRPKQRDFNQDWRKGSGTTRRDTNEPASWE